MSYGLATEQLRQICGVLKNHSSVESAVLYGSRAKGTYRLGSDIDITLKGRNITHKEFLHILNELDELFLPYCFDVSILSLIENDDVIEHINRVGKTIYQRNEIDENV
ncbi:nucleotidyltransferase domain-containing protein [Thalassotalea eurytherma]|uniref:Polymerase beta nucleotidyltransferase domain-containing protein n=1 Tax=Thalassotalea eurytherma TaxID=1144278 RepID=A0ABQ6GZC0_9GAMM|nr:nucleotidyltransferase domain-containing protein [Thalassotalea eurytherma]GLX81288.1 hypothetical protein theurythT_07400 [Thalassotalea eurytherma]